MNYHIKSYLNTIPRCFNNCGNIVMVLMAAVKLYIVSWGLISMNICIKTHWK